MRRSAATAILLALLALSCLAEGRRALMKSQAEKDAEALEKQQAQQDALVADQAEREAELLRKQVEAQDRKNRAAGSGSSDSGSSDSSSGDSSRGDGQQSSGKGSSSSNDDSSSDSQGCSKPDYSGMSSKDKRAAKKAYEKCRKAARSGASAEGSSGDSSGDSSAVTTKSLKRGDSGKGVRATFHFYSPAYETSSLYCADAFRGKEASLLGRPWTAYCATSILGPMSTDKCGRCIRVTNLATGDSIEATVVDMCGTGGMDLDPEAFNPIDSDGAGIRDGHMMVSVEWC